MTGSVLITGATGFVGRHVLRALFARGVPVSATVRRGNAHRLSAVPGVNRIVETDSVFAEPEPWWLQTLRDIDIVIHLAWYVEPGKYLMAPENLDCLCGTLRMAKAAAIAGVRRFVGIGTCFEYDLASGRVSTDTALKPLTLYAATKASTYMALSQWLPQNNVEFAWCRLFYLYGEGEDQRRFVPYLRNSLEAGKQADLTHGMQVRDFLDARDAAAMIVDVATGTEEGAINICSGVPMTIRAFAERIADEYGRRDLLNFGARPDNLLDPPSVVGIRQ